MICIVVKCDNPNCKCSKDGKRREREICGSSVVLEHKAVISLLKKAGWIVGSFHQYCSYHCEEDAQMNCSHSNGIKYDGYTICADCDKIFQPIEER